MHILYVVATPIGNLEDITIRAIKILLSVPVIACEDTRHTGNLIKILTDRYAAMTNNQETRNKKYISVRDFNEFRMVDRILQELAVNDVALVSDAGTPLISDPGYKIVRAARDAGFAVVPIPGPSAAIAALSAAGLPTNKFVFLGFLGKKWKLLPGYTHVIYENAVRLPKLLKLIKDKWPKSEIVIANELTKIHEKFINITPESPLNFSQARGFAVRGEISVLVYLPEEVAADHGNGNWNGQEGEDGGSNIG